MNKITKTWKDNDFHSERNPKFRCGNNMVIIEKSDNAQKLHRVTCVSGQGSSIYYVITFGGLGRPPPM